MSRIVLRTTLVAVWLVLVAWLVRYEAYPEAFTRSFDGYKGILARDVLLVDSWMRILYHGAPVGYTHMYMESGDETADAHCVINNRADVKVRFLGKPEKASIESSIALDSSYRLQKFIFTADLADYLVNVKGGRTQGRTFEVSIHTEGLPLDLPTPASSPDSPGSDYRLTVEIPDEAVVYSPASALAMRRMKVGQETTLRTVDPMTMRPASVVMKAVGVDTLRIDGEDVEATRILSESKGQKMTLWVDASGNVVRQETPLGWTLERCSAAAAIDAYKGSSNAVDLTAMLAGFLLNNPLSP